MAEAGFWRKNWGCSNVFHHIMMRQAAIKKTVNRHFKKLGKLYRKMKKKPDSDHIHDFRVAIKKLRAFLRMLKTAHKNTASIHRSLKKIYHKAGDVRNLQLFQQTFAGQTPSAIAANSWAGEQMAPAIARLEKSMKDKALSRAKESIMQHLPEKLSRKNIQAFNIKKMDKVQQLSRGPVFREEQLHELRKNLKDIMYDRRVTETYSGALSETDNDGKETQAYYKWLTDKLGEFQDCRIELGLLQQLQRKNKNGEMKGIGRMMHHQRQKKSRLMLLFKTQPFFQEQKPA